MKELLELLNQLPEYRGLKEAIGAGKGVVSIYGMSPVHKAHFAAALQQDTGRPLAVLCRDEGQARRFAADFENLSGAPAALLPAREYVFHNVEGSSREYEHQRLAALDQFSRARRPVLAAPVEAAMMAAMPPKALEQAAFTLAADQEISLEQLEDALTAAGYTRCLAVEGGGQFSVRGGIADIFPAGAQRPVRAEFFGDCVDSLGEFDIQTQRRLQNIKEARILPARETLPQLYPGGSPALAAELRRQADKKSSSEALAKNLRQDADRLEQQGLFPACDRYLPLIYPQLATALDYLPPDCLVLIDDSPGVKEAAGGFAYRVHEDVVSLLEQGCLLPGQAQFHIGFEQLKAALLQRQAVVMDSFLSSSGGFEPQAIFSLTAKQLPAYSGSLETALSDIRHYLELGYRVCVLAGGPQRLENMARLLEENQIAHSPNLEEQSAVCLLKGALSAGLEYPGIGLALLCDGAILQRRRQEGPKKKTSNRDRVKSFSDLVPGDYVVHEHHGIGDRKSVV